MRTCLGAITLSFAVCGGSIAAELFTDRFSFDTRVGTRLNTFTTDATGVALADEVPGPLSGNRALGNQLTFDRANTNLSRSFLLTALEDGGMTFDDDEGAGNLANFDNAISIGDIDNAQNDDWELIITDGPPMRAFGFTLRDSNGSAGETLSLLDGSGAVIEVISLGALATGNIFVGVVTDSDFMGVRFDEDSGGDDIAIADFVFRAPPVGNALDPIFYYFDEAEFLAETGATDLSGPLPGSTSNGSAQTVGAVEFVSHPPSTLNFGIWSDGLMDSFELALNGDEELNIVPESPVLAIGFQIEEAGVSHPNLIAQFRDSLFTVTLCTVRFSRGSECPTPAIIAARDFSPPQSNPPEYSPSFFGVWANVRIAQISIRETTLLSGDGNEFFGRVFAGTTPRAQPEVDQFERDPTPETAKLLVQSIASVRFPRRYVQDRSFHTNGDSDWIFYDSDLDRDFQFNLTSSDPDFHPVVELYRSERFSNPDASPVAVYGDCGGPPGDLTVGVDDYAEGRFALVRVRNCNPAGAPIRYEYEYRVTDLYDRGFDNPARLMGRVLVAGSMEPAGAFIQSSNGEVTFSNALTGAYSMVLTANREHVMTIYSPELDELQITIPAPSPLQNIVQDFIVGSDGGVVFASGFE